MTTLAAQLVLGDELMSKGDARGELIVVQCEIERGELERSRAIQFRRRERGLLHEAWVSRHANALRQVNLEYRRGFIDEITLSVEAWVRDEEEIWTLAPRLRLVRLHGLQFQSTHWGEEMAPDDWTHVRDKLAPALVSGRITGFCPIDSTVVWNRSGGSFDYDAKMESVDDRLLEWLIETKRLGTLQSLELRGPKPRVLEMLAREPMAEGLNELVLGGPGFGSAYDESTLPALETTKLAPERLLLSLAYGVVPDRRLLSSPLMRRVTHLSLEQLTDFSDFPIGKQLRVLETTASAQPGWAENIGRSTALSGLHELVIRPRYGEKGEVDLRPFCEPEHLESLRVLRLKTPFAMALAKDLLRSPLARRLEVLELDVPWHGAEEVELKKLAWDGILERPTGPQSSSVV